MVWKIYFSRAAKKRADRLEVKVRHILQLLASDLAEHGPRPGGNWHHYSKLRGMSGRDIRHCHLTKGQPTYVCCWEVLDKQIQIIEVMYVGTHEKR
jgi:hypothetical protein